MIFSMFHLLMAARDWPSCATLECLSRRSKSAHCRNNRGIERMDDLALASTMKRLTIWLDQTRQPAGFVSRQYDAAPFGRCYVSIDPDRQHKHASANWNRVHLCGAETGLRPEGLARSFGIISNRRLSVRTSSYARRGQETSQPPTRRSARRCGANTKGLWARRASPTSWRSMASARWPSVRSPCSRGSAYLTTAVTAEGDRGCGAHSALIAARIAKARELGCTAVAVETLTILERSLRNLERAGFRVVFEKEVYEWSVEPSG
jgi:hypothetical protein